MDEPAFTGEVLNPNVPLVEKLIKFELPTRNLNRLRQEI